MEALSQDSLPAEGETGDDAVRRLRESVLDERKRARNFGEDLTQYLLALDKLSGLVPEDRACRKGAIAVIEALLDEVDAAKSKIRSLEATVAALEAQAEGQRSKAQARAEAQAREAARTSEVAQAPAPRPKKPLRSAKEAWAPASPVTARPATARAAGPPPPSAELWERVELPLRLQAHEEEDRYVISLASPGMAPEDVRLQLDDDASLVIRVLRRPQAEDAAQMQRQVASHLRQLVMHSPAQLEQIRDSMEELAADAYARLGQGVFGRFVKTVEIPADADVGGIRSACRDGVLQVVLPKRPRRLAPTRRAPFLDEGLPAYGHAGLPAYGHARRPLARPRKQRLTDGGIRTGAWYKSRILHHGLFCFKRYVQCTLKSRFPSATSPTHCQTMQNYMI